MLINKIVIIGNTREYRHPNETKTNLAGSIYKIPKLQ